MAAGKEIRGKIANVENTKKITKAMELIAASKMQKAQKRTFVSRPYADKMLQVINHVAESRSEYRHRYLSATKEVKRVGYIIISSDRGLCGGLNINLFKQIIKDMKKWHDQNVEIDLCIIGNKAEVFFRRYSGNIIAQATHLGDTPTVSDLIGVVKVMFDKFDNKELDRVYIANNVFVNSMTQEPSVSQLLPVDVSTDPTEGAADAKPLWDYIYEPDARELLNILLARYVETQVYQAVIENLACEQAARMVAMKNATDNAKSLIEDLQLIYNKARQAAITQEIAEIVSGAAAI